MRRGDSEHHLNELQRWVWAVAISADTRDGHETLRQLLQPPRSLCASTGHYPHPFSRDLVQPATARVPWSRDNFPRRTHGTPQAVAMSRQPLPPQACPSFCTPHSSWPEWARAPYPPAPLTPSCLGGNRCPQVTYMQRQGQSKAEPQELCEQRREREISPSNLRSSRLNPHNHLDVPSTCGIPE